MQAVEPFLAHVCAQWLPWLSHQRQRVELVHTKLAVHTQPWAAPLLYRYGTCGGQGAQMTVWSGGRWHAGGLLPFLSLAAHGYSSTAPGPPQPVMSQVLGYPTCRLGLVVLEMKGFWTEASAHALCQPSVMVQVFQVICRHMHSLRTVGRLQS